MQTNRVNQRPGVIRRVLGITSHRILADIVVDHEIGELHALLVDPFVIEDGAIVWGGAGEPDVFDP